MGQHQNVHDKNKKIIYLDCDTMFTAYLSAGLLFDLTKENEAKIQDTGGKDMTIANETSFPLVKRNNEGHKGNNFKESIVKDNTKSRKLIDIYLPSERRFDSILGDIIASMPKASLVIFDSLNSFYNMYPTKLSQSKARQSRTISDDVHTQKKALETGSAIPSRIQDRLTPGNRRENSDFNW